MDKGGAKPRPRFLSWYTSEMMGVSLLTWDLSGVEVAAEAWLAEKDESAALRLSGMLW